MRKKKRAGDAVFEARFEKYFDELKWLYMELYPGQDEAFSGFCKNLKQYYEDRGEDQKHSDGERTADPDWYKGGRLMGMTLYVDAFAGTLKGVGEKLSYFQDCGVNYIHLMPLLDCPERGADGGYAVSDFRKVRPDLGTMEDLRELAALFHKNGISLCLDLVMNHTSDEHDWAMRAKAGEQAYQDRYFVFDNWDIPNLFEQSVPDIFPATAPGNFTWNPEMEKVVMTMFHPNQWDLDYRNPAVLEDMTGNMLYLANQGVDIIRLDAVPYIWKQLGTDCRNLPPVHSIVRILRIATEIVCPGVLLLGEVVMEPDKVLPYFGTVEKPECHMLYNVTAMASLWHTVATRDVRLLRRQIDMTNTLPREFTFQNYLRCHDDIGWCLDYAWLRNFHMEEIPHKSFLNEFLCGRYPGSFARGELYNESEALCDARLCGTTASLCGIEKAAYERDAEALELATRYDLTLHACMLSQSGIPVIYSGDEIGQENDYTYHEDEKKWDDSRNLHRGSFRWDLENRRHTRGTLQEQIFDGLRRFGEIRESLFVFGPDARVWTADTWDDALLCVIRATETEKLVTLFNFSEFERIAWINEDDGQYTDLLSGEMTEAKVVWMPAFGCRWLLRRAEAADAGEE